MPPWARMVGLLSLLLCPACPDSTGSGDARSDPDLFPWWEAGPRPDGAMLDAPRADLGDATQPACVTVGQKQTVAVATAPTADEYALTLPARSSSSTLWSQVGNEAVVLDVSTVHGLVGHLVLHQGHDTFSYGMHVGALQAGDAVSVKVSTLSAASPVREACVGPATLTASADLGAAGEGLVNAPIFKWPVVKRFDDLPLLLGWSEKTKKYEAVYSSENGGTVAICGGGSSGIEAEMARWGRACDIEQLYTYSGGGSWGRCTGTSSFSSHAPLMEQAHPIFYYGDGHNRLFESRGGYGKTCGSSSDEKADGDIAGWNVQSPGNDSTLDGPFVVILRPLPVDLDALGYATSSGTREQMLDAYAPWLYRITDSELVREGRIDNKKALPMERYVFVDVHASDVDGSGDRVCSWLGVDRGFMLRVKTTAGAVLEGPQMTASYFGGQINWKRLAIPLDKTYTAAGIKSFIFDAYDDDGIYFLDLGAAFMPRPQGDNGAVLEQIRQGIKAVNVYVDDDSSSCESGVNTDGPGGMSYPCVGSEHEVAK